jgi:hypothetical protein
MKTITVPYSTQKPNTPKIYTCFVQQNIVQSINNYHYHHTMNNLTTIPHSPSEVVAISPEELLVANTYLTTHSIESCASTLSLEPHYVSTVLDTPHVKSYISKIFNDMGFNNRFKIRQALDAVISKKFQELDEAGTGSSKDIAELLELSHKMSIKELELEIQLLKLKDKTPSIKKQVNVQVNNNNYHNLLNSLLNTT